MKLSPQNQLEEALLFALAVHRNQTDKGGTPYILHPLHIMHQLLPDLEAATVALLHDTLEDGVNLTMNTLLSKGFSVRISQAVKILTRPDTANYLDYIRHIGANRLATKVKLADLAHNLDTSRLGATPPSLSLVKRYTAATLYLTEVEQHRANR